MRIKIGILERSNKCTDPKFDFQSNETFLSEPVQEGSCQCQILYEYLYRGWLESGTMVGTAARLSSWIYQDSFVSYVLEQVLAHTVYTTLRRCSL